MVDIVNENNGPDIGRLMVWGLSPLLILLVPLIAMQLTEEVQWDIADFVCAGVLLAAAGTSYALLTSKGKMAGLRIWVGGIILVVLVLIWAQFAVGILP